MEIFILKNNKIINNKNNIIKLFSTLFFKIQYLFSYSKLIFSSFSTNKMTFDECKLFK